VISWVSDEEFASSAELVGDTQTPKLITCGGATRAH
jgi:hypothetical protein